MITPEGRTHYPRGIGIAYLGLVMLAASIVMIFSARESDLAIGLGKLGVLLAFGGGVVSIVVTVISGRKVKFWMFIPPILAIAVTVFLWWLIANVSIAF